TVTACRGVLCRAAAAWLRVPLAAVRAGWRGGGHRVRARHVVRAGVVLAGRSGWLCVPGAAPGAGLAAALLAVPGEPASLAAEPLAGAGGCPGEGGPAVQAGPLLGGHGRAPVRVPVALRMVSARCWWARI